MSSQTYVADARHRYSYEVRPDPDLDRAVRQLANELERDGLLEPGASTAPRFQPHVTLARAEVADPAVAERIAAVLAADPMVLLDEVGAFGSGRVVHTLPSTRVQLDAARRVVLDGIDDEQLDPLVFERAWTPHLTVAYAVPRNAAEAAFQRVASALPLTGRWATAEVWDLDVRPTTLVHQALIVAPD